MIDKEYIVNIEGIGLSIIDSIPSELLYVTLEKIDYTYTNSDMFRKWNGKIDNVQVMSTLFSSNHDVNGMD